MTKCSHLERGSRQKGKQHHAKILIEMNAMKGFAEKSCWSKSSCFSYDWHVTDISVTDSLPRRYDISQHQKKQWRYFSTSCVLVVSGDWWGCQINNLLFHVNIMEKDIRMNKTSTFCVIFCTRLGQIDYSLIDRLSTYFSWSSYAFQVQSLLLTINCHPSKVHRVSSFMSLCISQTVRMLITMFYVAVTRAPLLFVK